MSANVADFFEPWRTRARALLARGVRPEDATWHHPTQPALLEQPEASDDAPSDSTPRISSQLFQLLETCSCHRDPGRYALMYRVLWRSAHGERNLPAHVLDPDIVALDAMARSVRRDAHKMTAFVRFRQIAEEGSEPSYLAWHEPEHHILRRTAPFFVKRFGTMIWTIATPDGAAHWDRARLTFLPPGSTPLPPPDAKESLWLTYYENIFNPARLNVAAMQREMAQKYWSNLPEARLIPRLVAEAPERAGRMLANVAPFASEAEPRPRKPIAARVPIAFSPASREEDVLDECRRCELWKNATQAVPGRGPVPASLMLVGEQPGDEEDLAGRPFVGPAGRVLQAALVSAGLDAASIYVTNAVKHFHFEPRGKRRIHKTPTQRHVAACLDWLEAEIARVRPLVIVALGATAVSALCGGRISVGEARTRELRHHSGARIVASYHPSAILRAPLDAERERLQRALIEDLERARNASAELDRA